MCLAIPAAVTKILPDEMAVVSIDGVSKEISIALIEDLAVGDYVIIHVGYALTKIDPEEARRTLDLLRELSAE
ncbi:HypC/HybG/HupF family hydrogenase formation chaperone [Bradyrhizobium arachidis]|uniref:HypC/HybG/HupF family hydrogenase formation chaperone n=1 Tax=Bradyrhizobium arachidis TaxID=858423 RepID=UPI002162AFB2|nr:HypC/HybG/HupF family hydrogenase formation chaperone [Bradyrhizobium arachidis]UVO30645.1 HypC/HybG/HupF family hydrogenase formation chaperone [Bradyrhizobium arachidis]